MKRIYSYTAIAAFMSLAGCGGEGPGAEKTLWQVTLQCADVTGSLIPGHQWTGEVPGGVTFGLAYIKSIEENTGTAVIPRIEGYMFESLEPASVKVNGPVTVKALYMAEKATPGDKYDITIRYYDIDDPEQPLADDNLLEQVSEGVIVDAEYLSVYDKYIRVDGSYFLETRPSELKVGDDSPKVVDVVYRKTELTVNHYNKYTGAKLKETQKIVGEKNVGDKILSADFSVLLEDFVVDYNLTDNNLILSKDPNENVLNIYYQNANTQYTRHYRKHGQKDLPPEEQDELAKPDIIDGKTNYPVYSNASFQKVVGNYRYFRGCNPSYIILTDDPLENNIYVYMGLTPNGPE